MSQGTRKTKKTLPMVKPTASVKPSTAQAAKGLVAKPVTASRPEFPTRREVSSSLGRTASRTASLLGGAALLAGGIAHAGAPATPQQAKPVAPAPNQASRPAPPPDPTPDAPIDPALLANGSVDGKPLAEKTPSFRVYREGGGIGPAEMMWDPGEVEAYINWQLAKGGKLALKTDYAFEFEGVKLQLDGFDPDKNVGYAYLDKLHGDRDNYGKDVRAKLDKWAKDKKVQILVLDAGRVPDASTLKGKILKFLDVVKKSTPVAGKLS